jgi:hypothetical protein
MKRNMYYCGPFILAFKDSDSSDSEERPIARSSLKKAYKPPQLTEYGNVTRLTAGAAGTDMDGHGGRHGERFGPNRGGQGHW